MASGRVPALPLELVLYCVKYVIDEVVAANDVRALARLRLVSEDIRKDVELASKRCCVTLPPKWRVGTFSPVPWYRGKIVIERNPYATCDDVGEDLHRVLRMFCHEGCRIVEQCFALQPSELPFCSGTFIVTRKEPPASCSPCKRVACHDPEHTHNIPRRCEMCMRTVCYAPEHTCAMRVRSHKRCVVCRRSAGESSTSVCKGVHNDAGYHVTHVECMLCWKESIAPRFSEHKIRRNKFTIDPAPPPP